MASLNKFKSALVSKGIKTRVPERGARGLHSNQP